MDLYALVLCFIVQQEIKYHGLLLKAVQKFSNLYKTVFDYLSISSNDVKESALHLPPLEKPTWTNPPGGNEQNYKSECHFPRKLGADLSITI